MSEDEKPVLRLLVSSRDIKRKKKQVNKVVSKTYIGTIERLKIKRRENLCITKPHKPEDAKMSLPIEPLFEEFLDKKVKLTIEELEEE